MAESLAAQREELTKEFSNLREKHSLTSMKTVELTVRIETQI
jgi:acyl carrier protein